VGIWDSSLVEGRDKNSNKYHYTIDLPFDWFGIICMTTDIFFQNRLIQTTQTGSQWYSVTSISPLIFPAPTYLARESLTTEKKFNNIGPRCQCYKTLFSSLPMTRPNKLECLSLETLSSQALEFEGKAGVNRIGAPFRCFLLG
jgi:hypothetical protein